MRYLMCLLVGIAIFISITPVVASPNATYYRVYLTRESKDWYRDSSSGAYFETRYCYEYAYGEEALYDDVAQRLYFGRSTQCDVRNVISRYIRSYIDGDFEGWNGNTIVLLSNGQVWMQEEYHYEYTYVYSPTVIVYGIRGAWYMRVRGMSRAIQVSQLR
jgi:hypothetical protein